MERRIAAGLVALGVAIVVWRTAARSATSAPIGNGSAAAVATAKRKTNPRSQAHATVTGRITAGGKPVAHAHVCADTTTSVLGDVGRDAICTDSDATGAYQLAELYATDYRVAANARGFRPAVSRLHLDAGEQTTVDLTLPAGGVELVGTVADISGGPIAHAQLRAGEAVAESDDAGKFSLWVDPGSISVEATADGYAPASWNGDAPDHVELQLTPESSLSGTVILASGEPLADAHVEISGLDWRQPSVDTTSADDGTFHADRLAPGRYSITVRSAHAYGTSAGTVLVALAEHTDGIVISVVPAAQLTGTITTEKGKPCTDGSIRLTDDDHARSLYASGDSGGAIELGGVLPGTYHVVAYCSGFLSKDAGDVDIRDKDVTGTWAVEAGATVHGRVTMRDGTPVGGADLRFQGAGWGATTTAADGSYHVAGLAAGAYTVTTTSVHGLQPEQTSLDVAERATVEQDIVLDPAGTIKGVVVDARGAPVAGAYVHMRDVYGNASTNADGTFVIAPVLPGDHELAVELADRLLAKPGAQDPDSPEPIGTASVEAGGTATVRLVVDVETTEIRGVVVDATGVLARDVVVELSSSSSSGSGRPQLTGDDGAFRFPAVRGARYRIRAYAAGRGEATLDAEPGEPLHIQLTNTELTGVVRGAPDELTITISGQMWRTETFFRTGGKFTLHDLRPGNYNIVFDSADGHAERTVELGDVPAEPLDITLDPVFTLTGRVVSSDHAPIGGAAVQLRMGSQTLPDSGDSVATDAAGRFVIKRAHPGLATVRISSDTLSTIWTQTTITGPTLDADLIVNTTPQPPEDEYQDYDE